MLSTFGSGLMIAQIAPAENLGFWNGMNGGITNAAVGVSQIIFSRVYDGEPAHTYIAGLAPTGSPLWPLAPRAPVSPLTARWHCCMLSSPPWQV